MGAKTYRRKIYAGTFVPAVLLCVSILAAQPARAQQGKVRFPAPSISIYEGFREISRQAGMRFVVNLSSYDYNRRVDIPANEATVTEALDVLLEGTGKSYRITGQHVLIVDDKPAKTPKQPDGYVRSEEHNARFEGDLRDYRAKGVAAANKSPKTELKESVIEQRVEGPRDGIFNYPSVSRTIILTGADARSQATLRKLPRFAMKTNLLYAGAALTPNLGIEFGVGDKSSVELMLSYNPWNLKGTYEDNKKMVHRMVKAEYRWWMCERLNGHFIGAHALYANYNVSQHRVPLLFEKDFRYQGYALGAGVSYGYHLLLSRHWGLEFNAGFGAAYMNYEKKDCVKCGSLVGSFDKVYVGPTSLGIKLVFVIK